MKQEDFKLLEEFLLGRLSDEEREALEQRFRSEPELATARDELDEQIQAIGYVSLQEKLATYELPDDRDSSGVYSSQRTNQPEKVRPLWKRISSIAATIAILGIAVYFIAQSLSNQGPDLQKIFYQDPGLPTTMSGSDRYLFYDAMVDYKAGQYEIAIEKWEDVADVGRDTINYYTGMAFMGLGNNEQALDILSALPPASGLKDKASWYSVYLLIRQGNEDEARELIHTLPDTFEGYDEVLEYLSQEQ